MTRACGHKQLCSSFFFYHANGTVLTVSNSVGVSLFFYFYFFKQVMAIRLLRHILSLEKSTAACFQPPFAPIAQARHWLTPSTTRAKHTGALCVYTRRLEISQFMSWACRTRVYTGYRKPDAFCISDRQKPQFGPPQTPITWLKTAILVSSHKTANVLPAFGWCVCFFSHILVQINCSDTFFFLFSRLTKHK